MTKSPRLPQRTPSVFKDQFDFYSRRQERGEPIKESFGAFRVLAADCQFGTIGGNANIEDQLKTQLVCHTPDQWTRMELFSRREAMTLQDVLDFLMASEAAGQDVSGIAGSYSQLTVNQFGKQSKSELQQCFGCGR